MNYSLAMILNSIINLYTMIIFAWAILSWINKGKGIINDIYNVLGTVVEPYVKIFRRFIPPMGGMDLSPLIALLALQLVSRVIFAIHL
jgi:uncharacterized protein YggT (Ycf19 family)